MRHATTLLLLCSLASLAPAQLVCGDCDGNGSLTIIDALVAAMHEASIRVIPDPEFSWCNVVGTSGGSATPGAMIDIMDALEVARGSAGLVTLGCVDPCTGTPPEVTGVAATLPASGTVLVDYTLSDPGSDPLLLLAEFSIGGGAFQPATPGLGGDGTTGLGSSPGGTPHQFAWDTLADIPSDARQVELRLTPDDTCPTHGGVAGLSAPFNVCNGTVPSIAFTSPVPSSPPATTITFDYEVSDPEGDPADILFEYAVGGGAWQSATAGSGSNPVVGATASVAGSPGSFDWDAQTDLGGAATTGVVMRCTPMDACGLAGAAASIGPFDTSSGGVPTTLPQTLNDGAGYIWDIVGSYTCGVPGTPAIQNGTSDAFDGGMVLLVDGAYYPSSSAAMAEMSGRQISIGPATMSGLEVTRKIYVPTSEGYARFLEILVNPTGSPISAVVEIQTNPGSDSSTNVFGSSSGDLVFDTGDDWVCTDDSSPTSGDPSLIHVVGGDASATQPDAVTMTVFSCAATNGVGFEYNVTVPAGGRVVMMHFGSQNPNQTVASAKAPTISNLTITDALTGVSAGLQADMVNF